MKNEFVGEIAEWAFYKAVWTWKDDPPREVFTYGPIALGPDDAGDEYYNSIEHAMAAAIAEKYTGKRGAGGTGVGTAADWFMKMIGADK